MPRTPDELVFSFLTLRLSARGIVALVMAVSVSALILAFAYQVLRM